MKFLKYVAPLSLVVASLAYAAPHEKSFYAEGNIGASLYSLVKYIPNYNYSEHVGVGLNINLGYLFNRYVATEIGYTRYNLGGNNNAPNGVDLAAKFIYPFNVANHDLNVFAKIGPTYIFQRVTGTQTGGSGSRLRKSAGTLIGVGAAYQVTPKLDLNAQAQDSFIYFDSRNPTLFSVGLTYHFDM
ncbi:MAG: outer membrane beta-barrel protein [Gammaproteobacteria bacterium]|nr:outer membrane beta-barrel protein [Gammaproteobacteria bacterium]